MSGTQTSGAAGTTLLTSTTDAGATGGGAADAGATGDLQTSANTTGTATTTTTDTGTTDTKSSGADAGKGKEGETSAPAELELKLPEGVVADEAVLGEFKALATEAKLDSAAAQKVLDLHLKTLQSMETKRTAALAQQQEAWRSELKADKDIGGAAFDANIQAANKAIEKFGSPELRSLLDRGLGNHPELVRTFVRIGKAIGEDSIAGLGTGGSTVDPAKQELQNRYPSMFKKE